MRIRVLSLALITTLVACQGNPAAPEPAAVEVSILRGSGLIGTNLRDGADSATVNSVYMGGGARDGDGDGLVSANSTYSGGGNRDGDSPGPIGSGTSAAPDTTGRSPFLGGGGG